MFDISWWHLLLFAVTAIILIPSKDLPKVLRTLGRYVGDARKMAADFRRQVDDALRETEIAELKASVAQEMTSIEKTVSMSEEEKSWNSALTSAAATSGTQPENRIASAQAGPTGQIIPDVGASLPIVEARAETDLAASTGASVSVPVPKLLEPVGARQPNGANGKPADSRANDGIEIVRAGRGSVAQRAAAAWKKTAAGGDSDSGA